MSFKRASSVAALAIVLLAHAAGRSQAASCDPHLCDNLGLVDTPKPLRQFTQHISGFHGHSDNMAIQMQAEHYCSKLTEDVTQCAIFDSNKPNAILNGIEYLISERAFRSLPAQERQYWHSHKYEYLSGQAVIPEEKDADKEAKNLLDFAKKYGKTFSLWQPSDILPMGPPVLLMSFLRDRQLDPTLLANRDSELSTKLSARKQARSEFIDDITSLSPAPGADQWFYRRDLTAPQVFLGQTRLRGNILPLGFSYDAANVIQLPGSTVSAEPSEPSGDESSVPIGSAFTGSTPTGRSNLDENPNAVESTPTAESTMPSESTPAEYDAGASPSEETEAQPMATEQAT